MFSRQLLPRTRLGRRRVAGRPRATRPRGLYLVHLPIARRCGPVLERIMNREKSLRERYPGPWLIEELEESIRMSTRNGVVLLYIYPCKVQQFDGSGRPKPTWPEA